MGADPVRVPSCSCSTELWGWAPLMVMVTGPPPNASEEHWRVGFIPVAQGTWLPVMSVRGSWLNHATAPPMLRSRATVSAVGPKAMHPLIKLQQYYGTGSFDTFLTKFQRMASYLRWDEEDMFHHLCTSLEGAVGQVLWDIGPCVMTADIVHLLQTRLGVVDPGCGNRQ